MKREIEKRIGIRIETSKQTSWLDDIMDKISEKSADITRKLNERNRIKLK